LQGLSQRPLPNQISLSSFPNHLRNLQEEQEDLENPFLLDQIDSTLMKPGSEPPSLMLFADVSSPKEEVAEEEDPQMMTTKETEETTLQTMSLMRQIYRTMSLSPRDIKPMGSLP